MTSIPPSPGVKWPTSCCVQEFMRESIADVLNCALSTLSELSLVQSVKTNLFLNKKSHFPSLSAAAGINCSHLVQSVCLFFVDGAQKFPCRQYSFAFNHAFYGLIIVQTNTPVSVFVLFLGWSFFLGCCCL